MARIFGTVLILAGCAGFLYKWAEGEKARQRMAGEWIRLFVRWEYALEQEHVRLYDFLSFYETADASMQAFLDEVCVCMRNHQNPSGQKIWQDCLQKHKRELQIGQEGWEILTSAAGAFYGESSAENLRCNEISGRVTIGIFKKTAGVSACWNADRRGYDHSSGVKA